jgi:two-component system LytT family response regulator
MALIGCINYPHLETFPTIQKLFENSKKTAYKNNINLEENSLHMNPDYCDLSILIVDDEKKACLNLKSMLKEYVEMQVFVVGIAHNTRDAELQIVQHKPDAVFLDIDMPKENAFHFLNRISPVNFDIVFVTAFDEYALKAFKANAVDYILKPISILELKNAITKLRDRREYRKKINLGNNYDELSTQMQNRGPIRKIILKSSNCTEIVEFRHIYYVEAQSSYSKVVFLKGEEIKEMIMSNPLSEYEELFPVEWFFRAHRSYLLNCIHIKNLNSEDENYFVNLSRNFKIPVSRRRYQTLLEFLKNNEHL